MFAVSIPQRHWRRLLPFRFLYLSLGHRRPVRSLHGERRSGGRVQSDGVANLHRRAQDYDVLDLACLSRAERIERFHGQRHHNDRRGVCGLASAMASTRDSPGATG